jgi:outer membrane protein
MKKYLVVVLMLLFALTALGCGGRNTAFGVVDMQRIEAESSVYKDIKDDIMTKAKSAEETQKIMQDKSAEMQLVQTEAQNKLKASFNNALNQVAKDKNLGAILIKDAVPQGGVDVTDDVLKNMK